MSEPNIRVSNDNHSSAIPNEKAEAGISLMNFETDELSPMSSEELRIVSDEEAMDSEVLQRLKSLENIGDNRLTVFGCDKAQLFFIEPNGDVTSTFEFNRLTIWKIQDCSAEVFLEVGTWVYPLFSNASPCYRDENGIFIFPDIYSKLEGATVGLVLPPLESQALHEVLTELLSSGDDTRTRRNLDATVSDKMGSGSSYLARNLIRASENIAWSLDRMTSGFLERMPQQSKSVSHINPALEKSVQVAQHVSEKAANYSGYLSSNLRNAVTALGEYVSPYIKRKIGEQSIPLRAIHVASSLVESAGTIYNGLEESAAVLASSVSNNAVRVVDHRYGQPTAHLTKDILSTIGNMYATQRNLKVWKPLSIAKNTLRSAGQAMFEERSDARRIQAFGQPSNNSGLTVSSEGIPMP